jgi:hypothetical protein
MEPPVFGVEVGVDEFERRTRTKDGSIRTDGSYGLRGAA